MSARSDLINAASTVLSNPTGAGAVESGAPPSEVGLMGATTPDAARDEAEADATRVTEEEGTATPAEPTEASEPVVEAAPEEPKPAPAKEPAKSKFDAKGYTNQHAALTRRLKAAEAAEKKVMELISTKESEFSTREQKIAALEKLEELDDFELIDRVAKAKGKSANDILRAALWKQAGYKPEEGAKPEGEEQKPVALDPEVMKMIKEAREEAAAARAKQEAFEAKLADQERARAEREDQEFVRSLAEQALRLVNEDSYRYLAVEEPEDIARKYLDVATEQARLFNAGKIAAMPSTEDILEHLDVVHEREYLRRHDRLQAKSKGSTSAPSTPAVEPPPAPPVSKSPESLLKSSSGPKALTNAMTAQTGPLTGGQVSTERQRKADAAAYLKSKGF